ncbi:DUF3151 family protein [Acidipropionibacterium acidipropionici]|jgi:hypothetical protein|uniref:DUF3151 domain-containing protein n=1 Tax=Acidipropionibacterium acidipropionici TaxID=1748 RepID=A0ABN4U1J0_9ACTN|nr:DUF3151 domain-containing protein [Acidipropionibacterium acidipropionici]AOZ46694.1 hypothetical protein A8L58_08240 [Acidipropionibacterium acidipropionici]AZP37236.1 DUF3151 family protein [Acidipropionibacterium acidipropionici]QCV94272.1 DUF3151 family protein [Acidipropionibacterium acidipropionici]
MAEDQMHPDLLADTEPATRLPHDPAIAELADHGRQDFLSVVRDYPASSLCWALLAEGSLMAGTEAADIAGYAYARTGYHRGLDALRREGWKGQGPIPWEHLANQGFLRSLWALSVAADRIGEQDEAERCEQFLRDSSESGWQALHTTLIPTDVASPDDPAEEPGPDPEAAPSEDVPEPASGPEDTENPSDEAENDSADADPREDGGNSPESPDDERPAEEEQDRQAEAAQPQG